MGTEINSFIEKFKDYTDCYSLLIYSGSLSWRVNIASAGKTVKRHISTDLLNHVPDTLL